MTEIVYRKTAGEEPLAGYRLVTPLGHGGFGEVWKCIAPGGLLKAIKFVTEEKDNRLEPLRQEYEAFLRVKGIRHPFLLTLERVELLGGELIMVMELADQSLVQRYEACLQEGRPGIPRSELISYMVDAAEALDVLSKQHKLQHLDVKPANMFIVGGHVKVGDYGLVGRVEPNSISEGKLQRGLTPLYVAPEVIQNQVDSRSDQYSLALVYQELLTGRFAYEGTTAEQILYQHLYGTPNLDCFSANERSAMARALSKRPQERFPSCLDFVKALINAQNATTTTTVADVQTRTPPAILNQANDLHRTPTDLGATQSLHGKKPDSGSAPATESVVTKSGVYAGSGSIRAGTTAVDELKYAFPGYKLLQELETGPRGRIVRAVDAHKRNYQIHFVRTNSEDQHNDVFKAASTVHPWLLQTVSKPSPKCFAFCYAEEWQPLAKELAERKSRGQTYSRKEAIALLKPIALTLDQLHTNYGFPHGLISTQTMLIKDGHLKLTGYGIAELLRRTEPDLDWIGKEAGTAPEVAKGKAVFQSDQYKLAVIYLEFLNAWKLSKDLRTTMTRRGETNATIDWDLLRPKEIPVLRKALAPNPSDRFASCQEFIDALVNGLDSSLVYLDEVRLIESVARLNNRIDDRPPPAPEDYMRGLLQLIPKPAYGRTVQHAVKQPDHRWALLFPVMLNADMIRLKLQAFSEEFKCETVPINDDSWLFRMRAKAGKPAIELNVTIPSKHDSNACEVQVLGRTIGGLDPTSKVMPPALIEAMELLRRYMQTHERRKYERFRVDWQALAYAIDDELLISKAVEVRLHDISAGGASFRTPTEFEQSHLFLTFPGLPGQEWAILCRIIRTGELVTVQYVAA